MKFLMALLVCVGLLGCSTGYHTDLSMTECVERLGDRGLLGRKESSRKPDRRLKKFLFDIDNIKIGDGELQDREADEADLEVVEAELLESMRFKSSWRRSVWGGRKFYLQYSNGAKWPGMYYIWIDLHASESGGTDVDIEVDSSNLRPYFDLSGGELMRRYAELLEAKLR